jgi:hypothetical protein
MPVVRCLWLIAAIRVLMVAATHQRGMPVAVAPGSEATAVA